MSRFVIESSTRCSCGKFVELSSNGRLWTALCRRCYDPVEDALDRECVIGRGMAPGLALEAWALNHEEWEPEYTPTTISSFVVPKSPEGFVLHSDTGTVLGSLHEAQHHMSYLADCYHQQLGPILYGPLKESL